MNLPIDSISDSGVTVEQQQFNIGLFITSLGLSDSGLTTVQQQCDSGATLYRQQERHQKIDSVEILVR